MKIEENSQYHVGEVKITGAKALPPQVLEAALGLKTGDVYNETKLRDSFKSLTKFYGEGGYINFIPTPQQEFDEEKKIVNLTVDVDEGKQFTTKRINFSGNTTTRDKVIRREVPLFEGFVFNSRYWDAARMKLNQLGYFEEIKEEDAKIDASHDEPTVNVTMKVQEKSRNTIGFSGGVSVSAAASSAATYETNNFLGFGETLTLNVREERVSPTCCWVSGRIFWIAPCLSASTSSTAITKYDQARDSMASISRDLPSGWALRTGSISNSSVQDSASTEVIPLSFLESA
jgi:outer membrane protein insertion porin family